VALGRLGKATSSVVIWLQSYLHRSHIVTAPLLYTDPMPPSTTMETNTIKLFCWVHGDQSSFPIMICRDETIGDLKKAIVAEEPNSFRSIDSGQLELYIPDTKAVRKEFAFKDEETLVAHIC